LTGPLGDWLARLNASIASLQADPRVDVVVNWQAPGATVEQLDAVEAKLGVKLGPAIRNFYQQVNGLALVWGPKGECPKPLRGRPKMMYMESLGGARGAIYMPPVGDVFGVRGRAEFDYAQFMAGARRTGDSTSRATSTRRPLCGWATGCRCGWATITGRRGTGRR
jgi:hypothetical protein